MSHEILEPVSSVEQVGQLWPTAFDGDVQQLTQFVFHATGHFPEKLYDDLNDSFGSERTREEGQVFGVLSAIKRRERGDDGAGLSRFEFSKQFASRELFSTEMDQLADGLSELNPDEAIANIRQFFDKWGVKVVQDYTPSPLFPEGRRAYLDPPFEDDGSLGYTSYHSWFGAPFPGLGSGQVSESIVNYAHDTYKQKKLQERVANVLETTETLDPDTQSAYRQEFGAKAANLMIFEAYLKSVFEALPKSHYLKDFEIPPYMPISVNMFELWQNNDERFAEELEKVRQQALALVTPQEERLDRDITYYPVVAIRSSAVNSEDGDKQTGAGIYSSVAADPRDPEAFRKAIEAVYKSTDSETARSYREQHGIGNEAMGLLLQRYIDDEGSTDVIYGYVNSAGVNPNIVETTTDAGTLLFDKPKFLEWLLLDHEGYGEEWALHTVPDHSRHALRRMAHSGGDAIHAALLGEHFFGKPVQVEFARDQILQVRPLPIDTEKQVEAVQFPEDLEPIQWCKTNGVGDITLELIGRRGDNNEQEAIVVFGGEYAFTINNGYDAMPGKGGVIILNNDGKSGHIQMLCMERGLLCVYPDRDEEMADFEDYWYNLMQSRDSAPKKVRIVADGYKAAIYLVEE